MRPAAVLFDNDGLTLDTEPIWTRAEEALFARYGTPFTMDHKRYLLGSAPAVAARKLEELLGHPGDTLAEELYALTIAGFAHGVTPMPGALELVGALRSEGIPVGLVSNSRREFVDAALEAAGLMGLFATTVVGDEVEAPKPAPDAYLAAAAALDADPARCVALEDSPTGLAAARAAGMTTIGVPSVDGVALEADVVAASLAEAEVWAAVGIGHLAARVH
ncbi:MAG: HAD family hydrolase [Solirubrobacteraceae bacterium]